MELQTERLKIVPCTDELLSTISTEEYEIGPHITMFLEKLREDSTQLGWGVWLVINKENNTIIGDIGFKGKPNSENTVEVGYGIIPSAQNKGYATEAVKEIINWAFTNDDVDKVVAECLHDNIPSIKVLEKLNMNKIGTVNDMLKWELKKRR
ncbi:GNAT family N-acetyltransferase [Heyndrickxia oleronia]|uniref:GNAT family N-acetyltransferase n=1 Tax=Heyndrickxia oleronia TaxID=38875 RepID=A0A8E2I5E1_9BACI|nr:GNAT family N-acetyltransferase [Heyndrickxia oleronia]OJH17700.1 GNAT family N-acetyltransferase [Bacillus obstructivus]MCM3457309.1 GNAT family N-acetyltransferase [Heyndrickxia oleronia]MEC1373047.1 GNAT family N-acetyltransferase [Heyndrickxia oleronia]OOP66627.1 GNAT family N-acetyltransferase [Heyndrickxia oleronia]QQZ03758.1 GNAT family N-acetyltransferase [Heyndrickxia oleronia]